MTLRIVYVTIQNVDAASMRAPAEEVCRALSQRFRLYVVTNGVSHVQRRRMRDSGLEAYFSALFVSEELGVQKPRREFFELASSAIGGFCREKALIIGDSPTSDIGGGQAFGLDTCWFNPSGRPAPVPPPTWEESFRYRLPLLNAMMAATLEDGKSILFHGCLLLNDAGEGIVLTGESEVGKSTTFRRWIAAGGTGLCDDLMILTVLPSAGGGCRFCAQPGTADYGAITAAIARRADAKIVKLVPRRMFYPVPNVDSAVVQLNFVEGRIPVRDAKLYRATVRAAFLSRRKTLENNLMQAFQLPRERAQAVLQAAGVPEKARGETLSPEQLATLSDLLCDVQQTK